LENGSDLIAGPRHRAKDMENRLLGNDAAVSSARLGQAGENARVEFAGSARVAHAVKPISDHTRRAVYYR
jgi:hypothetical protein